MKTTRHISVYMLAPGAIFLLINVILTLCFLLRPSFSIIRKIYSLNTVAAPAVFLASALLGAIVCRRERSNFSLFRASMAYFSVAVVLVCVRIYATHIEPRRLVVRKVAFESSKVDLPLRILHISDIQSDKIGRYEQKAFTRMRNLDPDIVIHTGDFLQPLWPATVESELPKLGRLFHSLRPCLGVYGVYGDVDGELRNMHEKSFVGWLHILENAEVCFTYGNARIRVFGLTNQASRNPEEAAQLVRDWLAKSKPTDLTVLLGHSPDFAVAAQGFPLGLCLAGHTHGGQIRIPLVGPLITLTQHIPHSWTRGYREVGRTRLNVSAGIGSEHASDLPSIRVNCPSEMTLIIIRPREDEVRCAREI